MAPVETNKSKPLALLTRFAIGVAAAVLIPAFVVLAVAPMLLALTPVAFLALPFMVLAFARGACGGLIEQRLSKTEEDSSRPCCHDNTTISAKTRSRTPGRAAPPDATAQ
jgi:hypothetical protein